MSKRPSTSTDAPPPPPAKRTHTANRTPTADTSQAPEEDLHHFFRRLSDDISFKRLFTEQGVVLSLFRGLPSEQKCTVLRLLGLQEPIRWDPLISWHGNDRSAAFKAVSVLRTLRILVVHRPEQPVRGEVSRAESTAGSEVESAAGSRVRVAQPARYELHPTFKQTLILTCRPGGALLLGGGNKPPKHCPTKAILHAHAARQWKNMLQWIVSGSSSARNTALGRCLQFTTAGHPHEIPSNLDLLFLLRRLHVIREVHEMQVQGDLTSQTFHWLLRDIRSQVLTICLEYLRSLHYGHFITREPLCGSFPSSMQLPSPIPGTDNSAGMSDSRLLPPVPTEVAAAQTVEVLALMFTLSELLIGQRRFLQLAHSIGLVWQHKPAGAKHFFPTPFAKLLQSNSPYMMHVTSVASNLALLGSSGPRLPSLAALELPADLFYSGDGSSADSGAVNADSVNVMHEVLSLLWDNYSSDGSTLQQLHLKTLCRWLFCLSCPKGPFLSGIGTAKSMWWSARLCEIRVITPCLLVGSLTRETVRDAYKTGVTAEQIIRFFTSHALPSIYAKAQREGKPLLPENVATQLCIWEAERRRIRMNKACVLEFSKESDLDVFPIAVSRSQHFLIMHTPCPSTSDVNSPEFIEWKTAALEKLKSRPPAATTPAAVRATAPVLAVHAQYKDELSSLVRNAIRDVARK